jgi:phosphocarrier protein HPr
MSETQAVERSVRIINPFGLHARPAAQLVKMASRFVCEVQVGKDDLDVNAKSIMGVLMLAAEHGSEIRIRCEGEDAEEAVNEIVALVERGFEES